MMEHETVNLEILLCTWTLGASQVALAVKNPPAKEGDIRDAASVSGLGSSPGGGHGNSLQYYGLENPMDSEPGGLQSRGVTKSQT